MKVLMLSGSRNPQGQTARAAEAMLEGLRSGGAQVEALYLPILNLNRCRQCDDAGWGLCRSEGRCVIDDDFGQLVEKLQAADLAVFATPVYFSDLSESLRAFTDRLRRTSRHWASGKGFGGKKAVGICVAGGGGGGAPACCRSLEKTLITSGFEVVEMVAVRRQNLEMKIRTLQEAGCWLAE